MDVDQIGEHVATYKQYLELTNLKKDLIARYKESKNKLKKQKLEEAEL